jgi:hypothetical protein
LFLLGDLLTPGRPEVRDGPEQPVVHVHVASEQQVLQHRHVLEQLDVLEGASHPEAGDPAGFRPGELARGPSPRWRVILPACGRYRPLMQLSRLVLPAPLGPIRAWMLPWATWKLTSSRALTPPKCSVTPVISSWSAPGLSPAASTAGSQQYHVTVPDSRDLLGDRHGTPEQVDVLPA